MVGCTLIALAERTMERFRRLNAALRLPSRSSISKLKGTLSAIGMVHGTVDRRSASACPLINIIGYFFILIWDANSCQRATFVPRRSWLRHTTRSADRLPAGLLVKLESPRHTRRHGAPPTAESTLCGAPWIFLVLQFSSASAVAFDATPQPCIQPLGISPKQVPGHVARGVRRARRGAVPGYSP